MIFRFVLLVLLALCSACVSRPVTSPVAEYLSAQETMSGAILSPADEQDAVGRFRAFFGDITEASVTAKIPALYAENVFFNDTLKTVRGSQAIEAYFLKTTKHANFVRAKVVDVARSGENYYLRWVMDVQFAGSKEVIRTDGMTHLRFDKDGKIILHQDFWDSTAGFFEHLPVLGPTITWIKAQI